MLVNFYVSTVSRFTAPSGTLSSFWTGYVVSERIFVVEKRWKQITMQTCRIEWAGWWREDLTRAGTSDNLDRWNCQLTVQVVQQSCSETPTGRLSTWPLPRANSAGPRRRVAGQQDHKGSLPALQPDRRGRCEGSNIAAGPRLRGCGRRMTG